MTPILQLGQSPLSSYKEPAEQLRSSKMAILYSVPLYYYIAQHVVGITSRHIVVGQALKLRLKSLDKTAV